MADLLVESSLAVYLGQFIIYSPLPLVAHGVKSLVHLNAMHFMGKPLELCMWYATCEDSLFEARIPYSCWLWSLYCMLRASLKYEYS